MGRPLKTEAIKNLLNALAHQDLADLYNPNMEVQVNVTSEGEGVERVQRDFHGRNYQAYRDATGQEWKPFRIPWKANSDPEYTDRPMAFDLADKAEAIGMTGWDWKNRVSRWVAFDFDSLINHKSGLTEEQLNKIEQDVTNIEWVTVRKSTSGTGLHIYIFLEEVETQNHTEHAALGRAVLGQLNALCGQDLESQVDCCGGNMWVWHRKMTPENHGLELIKQGATLAAKDIPKNWKDHLEVVRGTRRKNLTFPKKSKRIKLKHSLKKLRASILILNWMRTTKKFYSG